jgi:hypothetical protein
MPSELREEVYSPVTMTRLRWPKITQRYQPRTRLDHDRRTDETMLVRRSSTAPHGAASAACAFLGFTAHSRDGDQSLLVMVITDSMDRDMREGAPNVRLDVVPTPWEEPNVEQFLSSRCSGSTHRSRRVAGSLTSLATISAALDAHQGTGSLARYPVWGHSKGASARRSPCIRLVLATFMARSRWCDARKRKGEKPVANAESRSNTIGPITLEVKQTGERHLRLAFRWPRRSLRLLLEPIVPFAGCTSPLLIATCGSGH